MEERTGFFRRMKSAAQSATSRSGEMVEAARLNGEISRLEADIEDLQFELGQAYCAAHKDDPAAEFASYLEKIAACEREIREKEERILARKGLMHCPECDTVIGTEDEYCSKCGKRLPGPPPVGDSVLCRNCGAEMDRTLIYCPRCGYKQGQEGE